MRAAATVLSNNILIRAKKEKIPVTPMKLQKLLYYVCVKYIKETGENPISEHFEVWQYGPVVATVYTEFKPFGAKNITKLYRNVEGEVNIINEELAPILKNCLDSVWGKFKYYSGIELSKLTQQRGSGWYAAFQAGRNAISTEEMRNDTTLGE